MSMAENVLLVITNVISAVLIVVLVKVCKK